MKVIDIINSSKKTFPSLEIVPPMKGIGKAELIESIRPFMEFNPKYINITCHRDEVAFTQNEDGSYARRIVRRRVSETAVCGAIMTELKVDVVPHVICGGATKDDIDNMLHDLKFLGVENVMALRGDSMLGEKRFTPMAGGYTHADELVAGIRHFEQEQGDCFSIGVGGYPEKHFEAANLESDISNLKRKIDAGADYIITQMFFDNNIFYQFRDKCRAAGIKVPIIPGLKPITTPRHITLLPESFSLDIPIELTREIEKVADDRKAVAEIGSSWCIGQCRDLIAHGVPAIHFYTMGKSENMIRILRECF